MLNDASHAGHAHVLPLRDHFQIHGPNGTHSVFISDIIAPLTLVLENVRRKLDGRVHCHLAWQLILAMDYLHTRGIVHGGELCTFPTNPISPLMTGRLAAEKLRNHLAGLH